MAFLEEVAAEKRKRYARKRRSLSEALKKEDTSLIAEVKRASPTKGKIRDVDPAEQAKAYVEAGASAISVLTEETHFCGSLEDLKKVSDAVDVPVLRKDFIVHRSQICEAVAYGADAVLLIASILKDETPDFMDYAGDHGLEALVEVHSEDDIQYVDDAPVMGINSRDLKTLEIDLSRFGKLRPLLAKNVLVVAESGINTREDVQLMHEAGADAVLVGSALMQSSDPHKKIGELLS